MEIELKRIDDAYHFELENERGHLTYIDAGAAVGGHDLAPSPMEYLLMGVAGCSAIDIIAILKKQKQHITDYRVKVKGVREKKGYATPFRQIEAVIYLEGKVNADKAKRAAKLSFEKYCSVSKTLEPTAIVNHRVIVNNKEV